MRYVQFGSVDLPTLTPDYDVGTGETRVNQFVLSGGGAYDADGSERTHRGVTPLPLKAELVEQTATAIDTAFDALRALVGTRDKLYAEFSNGDTRWVWARLANITANNTADTPLNLPIGFDFRVESDHWYGEFHDDTVFLADGTNPFVPGFPNVGNYPLTEMRISITAGAADITSVTWTQTGVAEWTYTGTVASGQDLVIDTGAQTVTNNGVGDYAHFNLTSNHVIDEWVRFQPGDNPLTVTLVGGATDSQMLPEYYDAWA